MFTLKMAPVPIEIAILCSLCLSATTANAQEIMKKCAGVEVRSVDVSPERADPKSATAAQTDISPTPAAAIVPGAEKAVMLVALGPNLSSIDFLKVKTDLACTKTGVVLTATITHSANDIDNLIPQGYVWHPRIKIIIVLHRPEIVFQTIWRMRLTTGAEVNHGQSPPFPDQKYPILVTTTIHSVSGQKQ